MTTDLDQDQRNAPESQQLSRQPNPFSPDQNRAEKLLERLVDINSPTPDAFAVNHVQTVLAQELRGLGFDVQFLPNPDPQNHTGDLLTATIQGTYDRYITFVSHADTVLDLKATGAYKKSADGQKATGSGVIDNKGGLVVAIEGLRLYLEKMKKSGGRPPLSLRFVSSPNEEGGSLGFHGEFAKCADDSAIVLGFEPALEDGSIVESRRGNRWYQITVKGQEAHAGRCRGEQINAAHDLAIKVSKLHALNDFENGMGVNIAQLSGGRDRFNVVCGEMSAKLDVRFSSFDDRENLHEAICKILLTPEVTSPVTGEASQTQFTIEDDCPPFSATSDSTPLLRLYLEQVSKIEGREVKSAKAGGAGDVNYMSRKGIAIFDGLGPIGGKMHTEDEFIHLPSLSSRAQALASFLDQIPEHL
jgi:glutamate carboxypeptidase